MTEPGTAATRRWWVLAVVSAAQFLTILDLWVVNIALPALQRDFTPATLAAAPTGLASAAPRHTTAQPLTRPAASPAGNWKRRAP
jgi:hypothetical protein